MPTYKVTDPDTGKTYRLQGESPPTEAELNEIFGSGDFDMGTMVSNIPSSAMKLATDTAEGMKSIVTGEALGNMQDIASGIAQKAAGGTPETFARPDRVAKTDAVWSAMKDRYGSMDALKRTAMTDPVGLASDVAGVLSGGAMIPGKVGAAVGKVGRAIDPINLPANTVTAVAGKPMARMIPDENLAGMYEESAKFSTTLPREQRARMAQTAIDQKIMPTYKGLDKLDRVRSDLGEKLTGLIKGATESGAKIPKARILAAAKKARSELDRTTNVNFETVAKQYDDLIAAQSARWDGLDDLTPTQVQAFKRSLDENINHSRAAKNMGQPGYQPGTESAQMDMRTASKQALEDIDPEIAKTNQDLGRVLELSENLPRSANRIENNNAVSLMTPVTAGAGAGVGGPAGGAIGTAVGVSQMPKPKAAMAIMLKELKTSPMSEIFFDNNGKLTGPGRVFLTQLSTQLGRLNQVDPQANSPRPPLR